MNNENIGQAVYVIKVDDSGAVKQLGQWQSQLDKTMGDGRQSTESLADGFSNLQDNIAQLVTAGASLIGLSSGISSVVDAYNEYESSLNGVKAVATATGNDIAASLQAVKDISASGLITQGDAAAAIKNLQIYGYSVQEATALINVMADAAAYNRQSNYSLSEAVRVTTEGIRMENSALSDASGITKNIAKMYEEYAAQLGKTTNNLTDTEKRQAVYNGVLAEGGIFAGNAASYTDTLAGSQQKLETSLSQVKQTIGAAFASLSPMINGIADWVSKNEELISGLTIFVGTLAGGAGLIAALNVGKTAISSFNSALTSLVGESVRAKAALLGIVGAIGLIATTALMNSATKSMKDLGGVTAVLPPAIGDTTDSINSLGSTSDASSKQVSKLQQSLEKLDRDYARSLKEIANKHGDNLKTLTQQIEEANVDYHRAIEERVADFNITLAKQERSHQETVDELMTQLAFLQRYNNDYNKQKLAQVEFALAKEQNLYKKETAALQAELDLQNSIDKEKLDTRLASLQQELDDEIAFMNKHRDTLNSVRDVILLDEIESLRERYEEQRKSYQEQIAEAAKAGTSAGEAFTNAYNRQLDDGLQRSVNTMTQASLDLANQVAANANKNKVDNSWFGQALSLFGTNSFTKGYASGGYTGRGARDEVAGVVHKGEYVVPAEYVDQNSGLPKMSTTQNITINLSGVLATSAQAKRDLALEIQKAIKQTNQTRLAA